LACLFDSGRRGQKTGQREPVGEAKYPPGSLSHQQYIATLRIQLHVFYVAEANGGDAPDLASAYSVEPRQNRVTANRQVLVATQRGKGVERRLAAFR
jgi:hypothetical protein